MRRQESVWIQHQPRKTSQYSHHIHITRHISADAGRTNIVCNMLLHVPAIDTQSIQSERHIIAGVIAYDQHRAIRPRNIDALERWRILSNKQLMFFFTAGHGGLSGCRALQNKVRQTAHQFIGIIT